MGDNAQDKPHSGPRWHQQQARCLRRVLQLAGQYELKPGTTHQPSQKRPHDWVCCLLVRPPGLSPWACAPINGSFSEGSNDGNGNAPADATTTTKKTPRSRRSSNNPPVIKSLKSAHSAEHITTSDNVLKKNEAPSDHAIKRKSPRVNDGSAKSLDKEQQQEDAKSKAKEKKKKKKTKKEHEMNESSNVKENEKKSKEKKWEPS